MNQTLNSYFSSTSNCLAQFLSPDPEACGAASEIQAPKNTQSYNHYAYCMNNPLKYTDPSGYLASNSGSQYNFNDPSDYQDNGISYYVDDVKVSGSIYRSFSGAGTSRAYGGSSFVGNHVYQQSILERTMNVEAVYILVGDGAFGKDGLFHGSRSSSSRTGLYGGMYNGSPFFTSSAESLEEDGGYLRGLALVDGGYSISFSLMDHWFSKPVPDAEIESNNPNYPGVTISYEWGRKMGYYNPFTKTIHVGEIFYMKTNSGQSWLQHEYGHYLQHISCGNYYFAGVVTKSLISAAINGYDAHNSIDVELEATTFAKNYFDCNGKSYNDKPTFYETKPVGLFQYSKPAIYMSIYLRFPR